MTTLNQIVQNLNEIANKHQQLHGFRFGDPWEFYTSGVCDCTELWVQLNTFPVTLNVIDFAFTIWLLDGVRRGEVNETEVLSDMIQVAKDVIDQLHDPNYPWAFDRNQSFQITPYTEKTPYKLSGVSFPLILKTQSVSDICRIPFSSPPIIYPLL